MQSKIIYDIFSNEQIQELKQIRNSTVVNNTGKKGYGREIRPLPNINLLPSTIQEQLINIASKTYGKQLKLYAVAFGRYSKEFGIPKLPPHIDEVPSQFTLDYQLDGNTTWPINVEGVDYVLKNNSALIFEGEFVLHWRPEKIFKDDEFLDLMWFQFIDNEHWAHKQEIRPDYSNFKKMLTEKLNKWKGFYNEA